MSGMLGQLLGGLMGSGGQGQSPLVNVLQQVLAQQGGVGGLVSKFQQAGYGQQANSWVGASANQPVSPEQVGHVFAPEQIEQWATQAGTTPDAMRQVLAEAVPHTVDQLTPGGQVPPPAQTQSADIGGMLQGLLGQLANRRT